MNLNTLEFQVRFSNLLGDFGQDISLCIVFLPYKPCTVVFPELLIHAANYLLSTYRILYYLDTLFNVTGSQRMKQTKISVLIELILY